MAKESGDQYSEQETIKRRDDALKRMLTTPHKPHKPLKPLRKKKKASKKSRSTAD
jgi:hypothetical protein